MSDIKDQKMIEVIKRTAADFMQRESTGQSLITITDVRLSKDGKYANILFTVLPDEKSETVLEFAKRKRSDFREYVGEKVKIGRMPLFDFEIDFGEKHRQKIDTIPLK